MNTNIKNYCSECKRINNHQILFCTNDIDYNTEIKTSKQIIQCLGCNYKSYRTEETSDYSISVNKKIYNYPQILKGHSDLEYLHHVPLRVRIVYEQTLLAFKAKSNLLTGVGFGAIIEAICIQENIQGSSLECKINNLVKDRFITEREADRLHSIRFLSNYYVHEMEVPNDNKLFVVLECIENLLKNLYIIDKQSENILETIIKDYDQFENLIKNCLSIVPLNQSFTLKEILGKHIRRIQEDIICFESTLVNKILNEEFPFINISEELNDHDITYIYVSEIEIFDDDLPF